MFFIYTNIFMRNNNENKYVYVIVYMRMFEWCNVFANKVLY